IGIVFGTVQSGPHDRHHGFVPCSIRTRPILARSAAEMHLLGGTSAAMALRKNLWLQLNGFDEMLGLGAPLCAAEETDFTLRALRLGCFVYETPNAVVVHHGFFRWDQRSQLIQRNWFGTGAAYAKALKQDTGAASLALARLAWRWAIGGKSPVAASLGDTP